MLTPNIQFPNIYRPETQPSKTYKFDMETGRIGGKIDGREAIEQFIRKTIHTIRYAFPIYSDDEGCEIRDLFGRGFTEKFIRSEIVRMVTEAIIYDDRIDRVHSFDFYAEDDAVYISFTVDTVEGTIDIKEVI